MGIIADILEFNSNNHSSSSSVQFRRKIFDPGHLEVSRKRIHGEREIIGHVYTEINGNETKYVSTDEFGQQLFQPTSHFNLVEKQFRRHARVLALLEYNPITIPSPEDYYSNYKININMKENQNSQFKKTNQLVFVEYEKPAKDGHFITVVDSYRNVIGRINKNYNEVSKKFDYTSFDHEGKQISKNEKLWQLKNEFTDQREELLEKAHQRRLESKDQGKQPDEKPIQATKPLQRKEEVEKVRNGKQKTEKGKEIAEDRKDVKSNEKTESKEHPEMTKIMEGEDIDTSPEDRDQELEDLRDSNEEDRGDFELER